MKAKNIQVGSTIVDLDGEELEVSETWPNQGLGLGIVILGNTVEKNTHKSLRYPDPDTDVRVVKPA